MLHEKISRLTLSSSIVGIIWAIKSVRLVLRHLVRFLYSASAVGVLSMASTSSIRVAKSDISIVSSMNWVSMVTQVERWLKYISWDKNIHLNIAVNERNCGGCGCCGGRRCHLPLSSGWSSFCDKKATNEAKLNDISIKDYHQQQLLQLLLLLLLDPPPPRWSQNHQLVDLWRLLRKNTFVFCL